VNYNELVKSYHKAPINTFELLESVHWDSGGSCDELEELGPHLIGEGHLHRPPEPLDDDVTGMIVALINKKTAFKLDHN